MATNTTAPAPTTSTSSSPSPSSTSTGDNGSTSKPLLFFVALGFGVVFTNLWIIVGVKYCFRYNNRNRMLNSENGEPIDLANMPRQRRRREKKLMTMDEVNERFPLTKYKLWRASRENEGLPAAGGVTAPPSRAASIRDADAVRNDSIVDKTSLERVSTEADPAVHNKTAKSPEMVTIPLNGTQGTSNNPDAAVAATNTTSDPRAPKIASLDYFARPPGSVSEKHNQEEHIEHVDEEDDDDDDAIQTALPNDLLQNPGDSCAICLDTLDDDDEVRGLTCGHAFHASCIDPWLTSRRACCPLCKADYYVPKPRPEGEAADDVAAVARRRRHRQAASVTRPAPAQTAGSLWVPGRGRAALHRARRSAGLSTDDSRPQQDDANDATEAEATRQDEQQTPQPNDQSSGSRSGVRFMGFVRSGGASIPTPRMPAFLRRTNNPSQEGTAPQTTPSQLEAGTAART